MRKSVQISLLVLSLAALLIIGGTMAWFTATADPVTNEFTAGTVEINLVDDFEEEGNWNPGDCNEKVVYVENTGTKCAFVRVKLTPTWYNEGGQTPALDPDTEKPLSTANVIYKYFDGDGFDTGVGPDWLLGDDGWYYYHDGEGLISLQGTFEKEAGEGYDATSHLIDRVCLDGPKTGNSTRAKS